MREGKFLQKILAVLLPLRNLLPHNIGLKIASYYKKQNIQSIKEQHYIQQLKIGLQEIDKKGTRINSMTPFFTNMITKQLNNHKIILDEDNIQNINQFLYMVNSNYYKQIQNSYKVNQERLKTREDVLREILESIIRNMEIKENYTFNDKSVKEVLDSCLFIREEVRNQMIEEFSNAKVQSILGKERYIIERKDIKVENIEKEYEEKYKEINKDDLSFDIYEKDSYSVAIEKIKEIDHYKKLGNTNNLNWDIEALMDICINIIDNYNNEMERDIDKYSIAIFAVRLILTTTSYALVNKKYNISYKEIINSFSKMTSIPINLQMKITKFLEEKYDSIIKEKEKQKILVLNNKLNQN